MTSLAGGPSLAPRAQGWGRLHPLTVVAAAAALITSTTALAWPALSLAVIAVALAAAATRGKALALTLGSLALLAPAWGSQVIIHGLSGRGSRTVLFEAGLLRVTAEGLDIAAQLALRLAVFVVVSLAVLLVVDRHQLIAAVDLSPVPPQIGYLVAATLGLLPALARRQRAIADAQALRLAGGVQARGVLRRRWSHLRLQAVPLVLFAIQDAVDRAPYLAARGFPARGLRPTRLRVVPDSRVQRVVRWAAAGAAVVVPALILGTRALAEAGAA